MAFEENKNAVCWRLNEDELQRVLSSNIGDHISCKVPISAPIVSNNDESDDLLWHLSLYPSGYDSDTAQFSFISLHTRSIPKNITNLCINYEISLNEIPFLWTEKNVNINKDHLLHILCPKDNHLQSKHLKSCKTISFSISITVTKVEYTHSKQQIEQKSEDLNYSSSDNEVLTNIETPFGSTPDGTTSYGDEYSDRSKATFCAERAEFECFPSSIIPKFDHCIKWTIRNHAFGKFIHCEMGRAMETNALFIDNFDFRLACFPNGHKEQNRGFVIVYLDVLGLADNVKNIRIHWSFCCEQTGTRSTSIKSLNNEKMGTMLWMPSSLRLSDLHNMEKSKKVSFILELSIIGINYHPKPINSHFQYIEHYKNKKRERFCFENVSMVWKVNKMRLESMKKCAMNQSFDSVQFDIWLIRILPKGELNGSNGFILTLKLLPYYLHRDVNGIVVRLVLKCEELDICWDEIGTFSKKERIWSCKWNLSHILDLSQVELEQITLNFEVRIVKMFGKNEREIENGEKCKYLKQAMDENDDKKMNIEHLVQIIKDLKSEINVLKKQRDAVNEHEEEKKDNNGTKDEMMKELIESNNVKEWFESILKLPYYANFIGDGFDNFETIAEVKNKDLVQMNIDKKGHRLKILKCINRDIKHYFV